MLDEGVRQMAHTKQGGALIIVLANGGRSEINKWLLLDGANRLGSGWRGKPSRRYNPDLIISVSVQALYSTFLPCSIDSRCFVSAYYSVAACLGCVVW